MADEKSNGEKARKIVSLLPKENCGKCGFENCGGFAMAVAEGKASPFGCHENPSAGYEISKVLGVEAPEEVKAQAGITTSTGMERGRGPGGGHDRGHGFVHHGKGGGGHRHSGKHHARRRGLKI